MNQAEVDLWHELTYGTTYKKFHGRAALDPRLSMRPIAMSRTGTGTLTLAQTANLAELASMDETSQRLKVEFDRYDSNHDGFINKVELHVVMDRLGMLEQHGTAADRTADIDKFLRTADKNRDGRLSFAEFRDHCFERSEVGDSAEANAREAFQRFDKDGDAELTAVELRRQMAGLGMLAGTDADKAVSTMLRSADDNFDGFLTFEEFKQHFWPKGDSLATREAFLRFDADRDGFISVDELKHGMVHLGMMIGLDDSGQKALAAEVMDGADTDGDGRLSYDEFRGIYRKLFPGNDNVHVREAFGCFDKNKNGFVSPAELRLTMEALQMLMGLSEADKVKKVAKFVKKADEDGDGLISYDEFLKHYDDLFVNGDKCHIREAFRRFDTNRDGLISRRDLLLGLEAMGMLSTLDARTRARMSDKLFDTADVNFDETISYAEFLQHYNRIFDVDDNVFLPKRVVAQKFFRTRVGLSRRADLDGIVARDST